METRKRKSDESDAAEFPAPTLEEIRFVILFFVRRGMKGSNILRELQTTYGDQAPSQAMINKWVSRFKTGNFTVQDDPREGRPRTSTDDQNLAAVKAAIDEDGRITQEKLGAMLNIGQEAVSRILSEIGYTKKSARWVPKLLTPEQKEARVSFAKKFLKQFKNGESPAFKKITTGDEAWFYKSEPETKKQSMVWSAKGAAPPIKAIRQKTATKTMFAIFFNYDGVVASIPLEKGQTMTSAVYTEKCLPQVLENIRRGRPESILRQHFLHHDNAPSHKAKKTQEFLAASGINVLEPPPYSPDLAPCDFWIFPKLKEPLRGKTFETEEEIEAAVKEQLDLLEKADFEQCFQRWIHRLKKCIEIGGEYVEKC